MDDRGKTATRHQNIVELRALSDSALLAGYCANRAPEAFAEIVRRHQPMVFRVCFRALADQHDAEDATQAVFLILTQRPELVRRNLAGWLHTVAQGTAVNLFHARVSQARREQEAARMRTTQVPGTDNQIREELDVALVRLPAELREAVVLRYLEGRDQEESARLAGCPRGTLSWRASEGLSRLRGLLQHRGLFLPSAVLVAFLTQEASAGGPAIILMGSLEGGRAALLAKSVMKGMFWAKIKSMAIAAVLTTAALATPLALTAVMREKTPAPWVALNTERAPLKGHSAGVNSLAFSPDSRTLATGSYDGSLRLWDPATGQSKAILRASAGRIHRVSFSPDGATLASQNDNATVQLWDVANARERSILRSPGGTVHTVVFSPAGRLLATASLDGTVRLWNTADGTEVATLRGHTDAVTPGAAFSMDGTLLATGSYDKTVILWDVAARKQRATLRGHTDTVPGVAFSPDGKTLASASWDGTVRLWDVKTGKERATLRGHSGHVVSLAISPDGKALATAGQDGTVKLWELATLEKRLSWRDYPGGPWSVKFSGDGKLLAVGCGDGTVKLRGSVPN